MNSQETIQIRIDAKTKKAARKTLDELGLDMSSAVKLFLTNVVNRKGIPFDLRTENGFTLAQEQALIAETEVAKKTGKSFSDLDELFSDLKL
ncbi:type II toxin-antitoxin system RelB/DinJ family antitoxin [Candidatus Nomurabacteria bacterium]|nr:type II toxin-antitoxin system RelB/DinJ family antitoxin [Candidatus Kaiserbacteria bacterium]MCB9815641.1 type II toxin-antitoxin system RelB/DinJ family antitoxin [Candidatus Nomurabacteria bacterium]